MITWLLIIGGTALAFLVFQYVHFAVIASGTDQETRGLGYFGLPADERARYKRNLGRHARFLAPLLRLLSKLSKPGFAQISVQADELAGPSGSCTEESFRAAFAYRPRPEDVFVATQMRSGTTWMQHLVYEVLRRGAGDLVETGTSLHAVSPWLESVRGPSIEAAPLVGDERPSRIVKTHLPADRCPRADAARYVYVARHPVSCFASCVDYVRASLGPLAPDAEAAESWFCSEDAMWWGPWTRHVAGWWERAQDDDNVAFFHFEEMKRDPDGTIRTLAGFLGLDPLTDAEVDAIREKTSFEYMRKHEPAFEMMPPNLLSVGSRMIVKGSATRHEEVPADRRRRILAWAARGLSDREFPLSGTYPDVAEAGAGSA